MKSTNFIVLILVVATLGGCGTKETKQGTFATSGSAQADQRAEQRMAKSQQLQGEAAGGKKGSGVVKSSLYDRLGGENGVRMIVDDFTPRVLADPRVNFERKGVTSGGFLGMNKASKTWDATPANIAKIKLHLEEFIALATGGPVKYTGKDIKGVHQGMKISNTEFDAAVGDLKATLDKLTVGTSEQKELLAIMESTRPQIVEVR